MERLKTSWRHRRTREAFMKDSEEKDMKVAKEQVASRTSLFQWSSNNSFKKDKKKNEHETRKLVKITRMYMSVECRL